MDATLTRNGETITLPLLDEGAASPLVARDIGKPESGEQNEQSFINPTWQDRWSQLHSFSLLGRFFNHDDAITFADFIKSHGAGSPIQLDVPLDEFDGPVDVAPAPEQTNALTLTYEPGQTDMVGVECTFTAIQNAFGSRGNEAHTPRDSGDGPITLSYGADSVELIADVNAERTVGRPNTELQRTVGDFPNYIDAGNAAHDELSLSAQFPHDAVSNAQALIDMTGVPLGNDALTLDFNGIYGMGAFDVVPDGSASIRMVRPSAEADVITIPSLDFRVVAV